MKTRSADVCIFGMGYVGLTLAVTLADRSLRVIGCEANQAVCVALNQGQPHFAEHGVAAALRRQVGDSLTIVSEPPAVLPPTVIICVGTPVDQNTRMPDLRQLNAAVQSIAECMTKDTLVIVRSTLPVGSCRQVVLPILQQRVADPLLAFCPERTIQGKALAELCSLPQIVGGVNQAATRRAATLFGVIAPQVITVSSLEAAEMIKLICNTHTDLIYGFGNQVALLAEALGLDALELVEAANLDYPRPDLCKPGFVGGSCLSKDPYLLMHSTPAGQRITPLIAAARSLNESLPGQVAQRVLDALSQRSRDPSEARVLISGFAYKGQPETDDLRGAPVDSLLAVLRGRVRHLVGHDFVIPADRIARFGVEPVSLEAGFAQADAAILLNNHASYQAQNIGDLISRMHRPAVLYDTWGVYRKQVPQHQRDLLYLRLGHG